MIAINEKEEKIINMYVKEERGYTLIAKVIHSSPTTVKKILIRNNIKLRNQSQIVKNIWNNPKYKKYQRNIHKGNIPSNKKPDCFVFCELCGEKKKINTCEKDGRKYCSLKCYWKTIGKKESLNRNSSKEILLKEIKKLLEKNIYPSRNYIESKYKIGLKNYFPNGIKEMYNKLDYEYNKKNIIKENLEKEIKLTYIVTNEIIPELNYEIIKVSIYENNKGADVVCLDENDEIVVFELKAFGKDTKIKKREIIQVQRYIKKYNPKKTYLVTTSDKIYNKDKSIKIIDYEKMKEFNLSKESLKELEEIRCPLTV